MMRRHRHYDRYPFAIAQRTHQFRTGYCGRNALTFHRLVVTDDKHLRAEAARHVDLVPLGGVQMVLLWRLRTQRTRLEAIELRLR